MAAGRGRRLREGPVARAGEAQLGDAAAFDLGVRRLLERAEAKLRVDATHRVADAEEVCEPVDGALDELVVLDTPP